MKSLPERAARARFLPVALLLFGASGCGGLDLANSGRYFSAERSPSFDEMALRRIGVVVMAEGATRRPGAFGKLGLSDVYAPEVTTALTMVPGDGTEASSVELRMAIEEYLRLLGYDAVAIALPSSTASLSVARSLELAREQGCDALMVVHYRLLTDLGRSERGQTLGYLMVPQAAIFGTAEGRRLWSFTWYGSVQHARTLNLAGEPPTVLLHASLEHLASESMRLAAKASARELFAPRHFRPAYDSLPPGPAPYRTF